jgi:DNA-directed RNA polymerase subunit E'/Rpb7
MVEQQANGSLYQKISEVLVCIKAFPVYYNSRIWMLSTTKSRSCWFHILVFYYEMTTLCRGVVMLHHAVGGIVVASFLC